MVCECLTDMSIMIKKVRRRIQHPKKVKIDRSHVLGIICKLAKTGYGSRNSIVTCTRLASSQSGPGSSRLIRAVEGIFRDGGRDCSTPPENIAYILYVGGQDSSDCGTLQTELTSLKTLVSFLVMTASRG
jgi:hypothetical protein